MIVNWCWTVNTKWSDAPPPPGFVVDSEQMKPMCFFCLASNGYPACKTVHKSPSIQWVYMANPSTSNNNNNNYWNVQSSNILVWRISVSSGQLQWSRLVHSMRQLVSF